LAGNVEFTTAKYLLSELEKQLLIYFKQRLIARRPVRSSQLQRTEGHMVKEKGGCQDLDILKNYWEMTVNSNTFLPSLCLRIEFNFTNKQNG
jgi:hypothetical protein